jgi:energy-coupling factor transporter ATP-binding protein EcfA2
MTPAATRVSLVGDPGTGKTTFLAAFYNAVQEPHGEITLNRHPEAARYLEEIRQAWLSEQEVPHTPSGHGEMIELDLTIGGQQVMVEIPDLNGESFRGVFTNRQVSETVDDLLASTAGLLVCVSGRALNLPMSLIEEQRIRGELPSRPNVATAPAVFDPANCPLDVKTVDLLQVIGERNTTMAPEERRVAVIVSAWDELRSVAQRPDGWVEANMPMLHQYLRSTLHEGGYRIYGMSAQGGPYKGDGEQASKNPAVRPQVLEPDGIEHHDVIAPFAWVVGA